METSALVFLVISCILFSIKYNLRIYLETGIGNTNSFNKVVLKEFINLVNYEFSRSSDIGIAVVLIE